MPKLTSRPPKLCVKKSRGTAYVNVNGREIYMGKVGPEADKNYRNFISSWANRSLAGVDSLSCNTKKKVTLEILFAEYIDYIGSIKNYSSSDLHRYKKIVSFVLNLYHNMPVSDFGTLELEAVRNAFEKEGYIKNGTSGKYSRKYLNRIVNCVRTVFKWGVSKTLVEIDTHARLQYVQPLREGRTEAPETKERQNVSDNDIEKTLKYIRSYYADIIRLLRLTGMRPSEACNIKMEDIDRSRKDGIWIYRPERHKTKSRGKRRFIAFGDHAKEIIKRHIKDKAENEYIFCPRDAREDFCSELLRKSKKTPSQKKRDAEREKNKYCHLKNQLSEESINRAVNRAIKRARSAGEFVNDWTPYCIRHQVVTDIAIKEGPVASQRIAGHASLNTTEIYDHSALMEIIELAKKYG